MLSIVLPIVELASFVMLLVLVGCVSKRPHWRVRAIVYGWGLSVILAGIWAILLPSLLRRVLDSQTLASAFPDGTLIMAMMFSGWMWPLIIVGIVYNLEHKKREE
jgi:NADH:ubiquinone oxidoreductase subunit 6 (subunit J)